VGAGLLFGAAALLTVLAATVALRAQEKNPYAGDAKVAKLGEYQFRSNCAFCHGLGARGGGRGPDLTRAYITLSSSGRLVSMTWPRPGLPLHWLKRR